MHSTDTVGGCASGDRQLVLDSDWLVSAIPPWFEKERDLDVHQRINELSSSSPEQLAEFLIGHLLTISPYTLQFWTTIEAFEVVVKRRLVSESSVLEIDELAAALCSEDPKVRTRALDVLAPHISSQEESLDSIVQAFEPLSSFLRPLGEELTRQCVDLLASWKNKPPVEGFNTEDPWCLENFLVLKESSVSDDDLNRFLAGAFLCSPNFEYKDDDLRWLFQLYYPKDSTRPKILASLHHPWTNSAMVTKAHVPLFQTTEGCQLLFELTHDGLS